MERAAAPVLGTLTGFLLAEHMGLPRWAFIGIVSVSLLFGIVASMGRVGQRRVTARQAVVNGGALWILTCALTFQLELSLPFSAIFALAMGLMGAQALEVLERFGGGALDWMLRRLIDPAALPPSREEMNEKIDAARKGVETRVLDEGVKLAELAKKLDGGKDV